MASLPRVDYVPCEIACDEGSRTCVCVADRYLALGFDSGHVSLFESLPPSTTSANAPEGGASTSSRGGFSRAPAAKSWALLWQKRLFQLDHSPAPPFAPKPREGNNTLGERTSESTPQTLPPGFLSSGGGEQAVSDAAAQVASVSERDEQEGGSSSSSSSRRPSVSGFSPRQPEQSATHGGLSRCSGIVAVSMNLSFLVAAAGFTVQVIELKTQDVAWKIDATERCLSLSVDPTVDKAYPRFLNAAKNGFFTPLILLGTRGKTLLAKKHSVRPQTIEVVHAGEGGVYCVKWGRNQIAAWTTEKGVKLLHTKTLQKISFIPLRNYEKAGVASAPGQRERSEMTLCIGNLVEIKVAKIREQVSAASASVHYFCEVVATVSMPLHERILGLAPDPRVASDLLVLSTGADQESAPNLLHHIVSLRSRTLLHTDEVNLAHGSEGGKTVYGGEARRCVGDSSSELGSSHVYDVGSRSSTKEPSTAAAPAPLPRAAANPRLAEYVIDESAPFRIPESRSVDEMLSLQRNGLQLSTGANGKPPPGSYIVVYGWFYCASSSGQLSSSGAAALSSPAPGSTVFIHRRDVLEDAMFLLSEKRYEEAVELLREEEHPALSRVLTTAVRGVLSLTRSVGEQTTEAREAAFLRAQQLVQRMGGPGAGGGMRVDRGVVQSVEGFYGTPTLDPSARAGPDTATSGSEDDSLSPSNQRFPEFPPWEQDILELFDEFNVVHIVATFLSPRKLDRVMCDLLLQRLPKILHEVLSLWPTDCYSLEMITVLLQRCCEAILEEHQQQASVEQGGRSRCRTSTKRAYNHLQQASAQCLALLYEKRQKTLDSLRTLLQFGCLTVFSSLRRVSLVASATGGPAGRTTSSTTAAGVKQWILDHLEDLFCLDVDLCTNFLVDRYLELQTKEVIARLEEIVAEHPEVVGAAAAAAQEASCTPIVSAKTSPAQDGEEGARANANAIAEEENTNSSQEQQRHAKTPSFWLHVYLKQMLKRDFAQVRDCSDRQLQLFVEFEPAGLLAFLKQSTNYNIQDALVLCRREKLYDVQVYLLGRAGLSKEALKILLEKLKDVKKAVAFCSQEQADGVLWEQLIDFICESTASKEGGAEAGIRAASSRCLLGEFFESIDASMTQWVQPSKVLKRIEATVGGSSGDVAGQTTNKEVGVELVPRGAGRKAGRETSDEEVDASSSSLSNVLHSLLHDFDAYSGLHKTCNALAEAECQRLGYDRQWGQRLGITIDPATEIFTEAAAPGAGGSLGGSGAAGIPPPDSE
eukprot:g11946.t1